jgi:hypothetical protein
MTMDTTKSAIVAEMKTAWARSQSMSAVLGFGLCCSCYLGAAVGPTFPVGGPAPSSAGANGAFEFGLTYDYRRLVRVSYIASLQGFGGAVFTSGGQHVIAPLPGSLDVDVTVLRFDPSLLLRITGRGYYGSGVRVGESGKEVSQPGSHAFGGLLGATLHLATPPDDDSGLGPAGLSVTAGLLVARVDAGAGAIGGQTFLAPMVILGGEFSPPHMIYCWLIDDSCPHVKPPRKDGRARESGRDN